MIEKLNVGFVNTWVLRNDLMRLAGVGAAASSPASQHADEARETSAVGQKRLRPSEETLAFAKRVHERYTYPVDSLIFDSDGKFVADLAASDVLMDFHGGDKRYREFLTKAAGAKSSP